ncbi:MAG: Ig-like domain-containing protein [Chloroflexota bacterium]
MRRTIAVIAAACLALALPPASASAASPVAVDDPSTVIAEDSGPAVIDVLANDLPGEGGPLAVASVTVPTKGTAAISPDGLAVIFEPGPDENGVATFTYRAIEGAVLTESATVTVTVTPVNNAPVANDDPSLACFPAVFGGAFPIPEDWHDPSAGAGFEEWFLMVGSCGLLANDTDVDGDHLTYEILDGPAHG